MFTFVHILYDSGGMYASAYVGGTKSTFAMY